MSIATYSELQASVKAWLHRGDMDAIVPDFIMLAEKRINGDLDARLQDAVSSLSITAGVDTIALPTDLINIRSLTIQSDPVRVLTYVAPDQFSRTYPNSGTSEPSIYTVIGANIHIASIPDADYTAEIIYKSKVASLSDSSPTNWLLTGYPHVYLYGALCEAAPYLKDDNRIAVWEGKYKEAIETVNSQDWYSGSTMVVRTDVRQ